MEKVMKNRNVMLNSTGCGVEAALVRYLCIFLAVFAFASCSDLADSKNTADSSENNGKAKVCIVSGKISIGESSGATSSTLMAKYLSKVESVEPANDAASRSATSSLKEYTNTLNGVLTVTASKDGSSEQITCDVTTEDDGTKTYSLKLTAPGDWTLQAVQRANVDDGTGSIYILDGTATVTVDEDYSPVTQDIVMSPNCFPDSMTGGISLSITDGTTESKIKSVTYYCKKLLNSTNNANSLLKENLVAFTENEAKIELSNVKPNCYEVTFIFSDAAGNTLYKCKEAVTVYGGFKTDMWFGEGSHLVKNAEGTVEFVITDKLIEAYGTEIVSSTKTVLYDYYSSVSGDQTITGYWYYLMDKEDNSLDTENSPPNYSTSNGKEMDFCFGSDDTVYFLYFGENSANSIMSTGSTKRVSFDSTNVVESMAFDQKTSTLYVISPMTMATSSTEPGNITIHKITDFDNSETTPYNISIPYELPINSSNATCKGFVIDNNIAYILFEKNFLESGWGGSSYVTSSSVYLAKANLSSATESEGRYTLALTSTDIQYDNEKCYFVARGGVEITDCIYQDEMVYILIASKESNTNATYSRGGILSYSTVFGGFKTIEGWAEETSVTSITSAVMIGDSLLYEKTGENEYVPVVKDWTLETNAPYAFGTPYDSIDSHFAGPKKILAIKPKKLVVADSGIAFYTDDDGSLKYKEVNRVVYVDLDTFSLSESVSVATEFASSYPDIKSIGCGFNLDIPEEDYYLRNGDDYELCTSGTTYEASPYFIKGE